MSLLLRSFRPALPLARQSLLPLAIAPRRYVQSVSKTDLFDATPDTNKLKRAPGSNLPEHPLSEDAGDVLGHAVSDVKESLSDVTGKAKRMGKKVKKQVGEMGMPDHSGDRRMLHTTSASYSGWRFDDMPYDEGGIDNLKDDARRVKQHASNRMSQASNEAENVGIEIKEKGQEMMHGAKKAARRVKEAINEATGTAQASSSQPASAAFDETDMESASAPVRHAARSSQLSTTAGRRGSANTFAGMDEAPEQAAREGSEVMGESQSSVKKSFLDGPQEMPQGPGKRATDAQGRPLETGTRGS